MVLPGLQSEGAEGRLPALKDTMSASRSRTKFGRRHFLMLNLGNQSIAEVQDFSTRAYLLGESAEPKQQARLPLGQELAGLAGWQQLVAEGHTRFPELRLRRQARPAILPC